MNQPPPACLLRIILPMQTVRHQQAETVRHCRQASPHGSGRAACVLPTSFPWFWNHFSLQLGITRITRIVCMTAASPAGPLISHRTLHLPHDSCMTQNESALLPDDSVRVIAAMCDPSPPCSIPHYRTRLRCGWSDSSSHSIVLIRRKCRQCSVRSP